MAAVRFDTSRKYITNDEGKTLKVHPAVNKLRRLSTVRVERIKLLKKMFDRGMSVQEIAKSLGWKKHMIYQEMYNMKKLGMLPSDFKNPVSIWYKSPEELLKELKRDGEKG